MLLHKPEKIQQDLTVNSIREYWFVIQYEEYRYITHFLMTSCFFCSSDVGRPSSFCLWSYIIFSTRPLVSPSRSDSLLGSGFTFFVLISGSLVITCAHHCILFTCDRQTLVSLLIIRNIATIMLSPQINKINVLYINVYIIIIPLTVIGSVYF